MAFIKSLSVASYFYVIHAVINGNLRSLFLDVANETKKDWSFERVNQIRNYVEYVQNELSDVMMGLQGLRKFFRPFLGGLGF
ncbi:hypothetical protein HML84_07760 [Alcanivorax sp. IO_7]|nr:hypothetical protein HML84_07760 [Alcanivorax sp. IO_7]